MAGKAIAFTHPLRRSHAIKRLGGYNSFVIGGGLGVAVDLFKYFEVFFEIWAFSADGDSPPGKDRFGVDGSGSEFLVAGFGHLVKDNRFEGLEMVVIVIVLDVGQVIDGFCFEIVH